MRPFMLLVFAPVAFAISTPACAQEYADKSKSQIHSFYTGNALKSLCDENQTACASYVMGFSDAMSFFQDVNVVRYYCPPLGIQGGQVADIVKRYLENNPEYRHWGAATLVYIALGTAYPCPK